MSVPGEPRLFGAEPSAMLDIIEISKDEEPGRDWCRRPVKAEGRARVIPVEDSAGTISVVEHGRDWCRPVKAEGRARVIPVEDSAGTITVVDYGETITVEDYAEAVVVEEYWEAVRAKRATAVSVASSLQQIIDVDFVEDADVEIIEDRKGKGITTYSRKKGRRSVIEQGESSGSRALDHPSPAMGTPPSPLPLLPTAVCGICLEDKLHSECSAMNGCDHLFCSDCIVKYVEAKVQENVTAVKCPQPGCKDGSLDPLICRAILPDQVFERWCTALCEALFAGEASFYCPFKDCSALLIDEPVCSDEKVDVITHSECPHCHRLFCARCKVPWHADVTCDVFQSLGADERGRDDILLMEMAKSKEWQRCPTCKFYVERTQGCMFIKCRCGSCFCYGCATPMTVEHYCTKCRR